MQLEIILQQALRKIKMLTALKQGLPSALVCFVITFVLTYDKGLEPLRLALAFVVVLAWFTLVAFFRKS